MTFEKFSALVIADPHMSNRLPYSKPTENGLTDRFEDQLSLWGSVGTVVKDRGVDAVFILGDLFDRSLVDAVTLTHTVEVITNLECDVFILPGNHDANSAGGRFVVEAFGKMKNNRVQVIGESEGATLQVELKKATLEFWPMAYKPVKQTEKELETIRKKINSKHKNFLLIHNSIVGAQHYGWTCNDGLEADNVCEGFERVYAGHFHTSQTFGKEMKGLYVGSPMHHDFSDVGVTSGFLLVEFGGDGKFKEEFFQSTLPEFHVCRDLKEKVGAKIGDYLRFEIEATNAQWVKAKVKAKELCESLKKESGINAMFVTSQSRTTNRGSTTVILKARWT